MMIKEHEMENGEFIIEHGIDELRASRFRVGFRVSIG